MCEQIAVMLNRQKKKKIVVRYQSTLSLQTICSVYLPF